MAVVFHGTQVETGGTTSRCPGHAALVSSQSFVDHLEFARWLRVQFNVEEFLEEAP